MGRMFDIGFGLLLLTVASGCQEGSTDVDRDWNGGVGGFGGELSPYGPDLAPPPGGTSSTTLHRGDLLWMGAAGSPETETVTTSCAGEDVIALGRFEGTLTFEAGQENETTIGSMGAGPSVFVARYEHDGWLAWARELGHGALRGSLCQQLGQSTFVVGTFGGDVTFELPEGNKTLQAKTDSDVFVARLDRDGQVLDAHVLVQGAANVRGMHCSAAPGCIVVGDFRGTARLWPEQGALHRDLVSRGERDVFVAPLGAPRKDIGWPVQFGGVGDERASAIAPWGDGSGPWADDGHFVVGSLSAHVYGEKGDAVLRPVGGTDAFVMHLDRNGVRTWATTMGGPDDDTAVSVVATPDTVLVGGLFGRGALEPSYLELDDGTIIDSEGGTDAFLATFEFDDGPRGTTLLYAYGIGSPGNDVMTSMVPRMGGNLMPEVEGVFVTGHFGGGGPLWFRNEQTDARCSDGDGGFVASIDRLDTASPAWTRHYCGARVQGAVAGIESLHVFGDFERGTVFGAGEPFEQRPIGVGERDAFVAKLLP